MGEKILKSKKIYITLGGCAKLYVLFVGLVEETLHRNNIKNDIYI